MSAPAGWYQDGQGSIRYWNGGEWTGHVSPGDATHQAEAAPLLPYAQAESRQQFEPYRQPLPQAYVQQPAYVQRPGTTNGVGIAGFVVGLVSIFLPLIFGLAAGVTGLVLSIVGITRAGLSGTGKGLSIAGLVLSILGILFIL